MSRLSELKSPQLNWIKDHYGSEIICHPCANGVTRLEYHISCGTFHTIRTASWMDISLAIGGMMLVDMPLCHNILMPMASLASSAILYGLTSTVKQLGYVQNFTKIEGVNTPLADRIHNHFHKAVHFVEDGLYQIYHLASSQLLTSEINNTLHNHHSKHHHDEHLDHHEHHDNHPLIHIITEPISEISIGWIGSKASGRTLLQIAHSVDALHYLLPSWAAIESAAPAVANGHAMAELFWITSSLLGPFYDVCVTGLDPAELVGYHADTLKESGALVIQTISLPLKWFTTHEEPVFGEIAFENEVYTNSTMFTDDKHCFAEEANELFIIPLGMCSLNEAH